MQDRSKPIGQDDAEWQAFIARLEAAEEEFARGRPGAFKALWSHADDVTLSGGLAGNVELGWPDVSARLDWASAQYADGTRSRQEIGGSVGAELAYLVQTEVIEARIGGRAERSRQALRATMVFRREPEGWRIVHRHADAQASVRPPE